MDNDLRTNYKKIIYELVRSFSCWGASERGCSKMTASFFLPVVKRELFAFCQNDCSQFIRHGDKRGMTACQGINTSDLTCFYHRLLCRIADGIVVQGVDIYLSDAAIILFGQMDGCCKGSQWLRFNIGSNKVLHLPRCIGSKNFSCSWSKKNMGINTLLPFYSNRSHFYTNIVI